MIQVAEFLFDEAPLKTANLTGYIKLATASEAMGMKHDKPGIFYENTHCTLFIADLIGWLP